MCVQGFDINMEEARLLLGLCPQVGDVDAAIADGQLLGGVGGAVVSPEALKALAEGFESVTGKKIIPAMGAGQDADKLLADEMLDTYDSPEVRKIIKAVFLAVLSELCENVEEVMDALKPYIEGQLQPSIDKTVLSMLKLNPAVEALVKTFEEKKGGETEANELLSLISGIVACSIPGALKECCTDKDDLEEVAFKATLLGCIEDSIKDILGEDGTMSAGVTQDIKELFKLAKEINSDSNKSFFAKVSAVSEGRCNSKFMDTLLSKLSSSGRMNGMCTEDMLAKIINIMGSRMPLQEGFKDMMENNPDFMQEMLKNLAKEGKKHGGNVNAVDMLHSAIVKAVDSSCKKQLDSLISQLESGDGRALADDDVRSMLKQAAGLAKYMGRDYVTDALNAIIDDPDAITAIRDDGMARDVLRKILVMRRMAGKDEQKRRKLQQLESYTSDCEEDSSLREFLDQTDALTRSPNAGKLKKSKSMVKKSKSMIVTAKDIPLNAFMALKNTASEKDEKWLQNFLSESVVEEIPWECSKALIILKDGFQAIIPREASKSILLDEASYTLIDDNGVEFYLSDEDKKRRERGEDARERDLTDKKKRSGTIAEVLSADKHYQRAAAKLVTKEDNKGAKEVINLSWYSYTGCFYSLYPTLYFVYSMMTRIYRAWTLTRMVVTQVKNYHLTENKLRHLNE